MHCNIMMVSLYLDIGRWEATPASNHFTQQFYYQKETIDLNIVDHKTITMEKILEEMLANWMLETADNQKAFSDMPFGFRRSNSTVSAIKSRDGVGSQERHEHVTECTPHWQEAQIRKRLRCPTQPGSIRDHYWVHSCEICAMKCHAYLSLSEGVKAVGFVDDIAMVTMAKRSH